MKPPTVSEAFASKARSGNCDIDCTEPAKLRLTFCKLIRNLDVRTEVNLRRKYLVSEPRNYDHHECKHERLLEPDDNACGGEFVASNLVHVSVTSFY